MTASAATSSSSAADPTGEIGEIAPHSAARARPPRQRRAEHGAAVNTRVHHRRIAAEVAEKQQQRRQKKKEEADKHVDTWAQAHASIYAQLASLPEIGPPLFPEAWTAGDVINGDPKTLRRAYHRAAARLHPDKVSSLLVSAQALAEELFKALGDAYNKELKRINEGVTA